MKLTTKLISLSFIKEYMKLQPTKKIFIPKDWSFFKRRIKYRKCLIDAYKKVGFSFPIGMDFFDNSIKEKDDLWEKRKNWVIKWVIKNFLMSIAISIISLLIVNIIF